LQPASTISRLGRSSAVRFVIVGGASMATNLAALFLLHGVRALPLWLAAAMSYLTAFGVNFGLNRVWTFEADGAMFGHLWRYLSLSLLNLVLTTVLVPGLTALGLPYLISQATTTVSLATANFLVSRRWIFTRQHDRVDATNVL
jgi:putative flippase GtrA